MKYNMINVKKICYVLRDFGFAYLIQRCLYKGRYYKMIPLIKKRLHRFCDNNIHFNASLDIIPIDDIKKFKIWIFWWQGQNNMPEIVSQCVNSVMVNTEGFDVVIVTKDNYSIYVDIEDFIIDKLNEGKISLTHFSDILRFNLLCKYGGLWLDATIFLTDSLNNHKEWFTNRFFTQKMSDGFIREKYNNPSEGRWAGFIMSTNVINNPLFYYGKIIFDEYWRKYDCLIDYYLIDYVIDYCYNRFDYVKNEIDDVLPNNELIFKLMDLINKKWTTELEGIWIDIKKETYFFKLSYKRNISYSKDSVFTKLLCKRMTD